MILFAQVLSVIAWLAVLFFLIRSLCILNHMTKSTALPFKLSKILVALAALALLVSPLYGDALIAAIAHDALVLGVALIWLLDRRVNPLTAEQRR